MLIYKQTNLIRSVALRKWFRQLPAVVDEDELKDVECGMEEELEWDAAAAEDLLSTNESEITSPES